MLVTEQNVNSMLRLLSKPKRLAVDTETTDLYTGHGARICGIAVGIPPASLRRCFYFPFRHESGDNLSKTRLRQLIGVLSRRDLIMTGWNFNKFDVHMLLAESMREPEYAEDVMLMLHLLNENERFMGGSYELKTAATRYVDPAARETQLAMKMRMADLGFQSHELWKLSPKEVAPYACADVYYTERLRERMIGPLREWRLDTIWHEVNRYALISRRFEERGLLLDVPLMRRYAKEAEKQVGRYERLIRKMAGYNINLNSNKQLQNWLGVFSTAKDALGRMKGKAPKALITYRQWFRVLSAYYRAYKERMDEHHVLHPNIKLHGTISGRLSAEDPTLQAVPRYTEVYKVKDIFIARPHHLLISADYSQMELRLGAHYARDEFLIGAFRTGKNVHAMTAKDFADLGVTYDSAKRINFAVQYGTGASSLAEEIGCTLERAQQFLDRMHKLHPNYRPLIGRLSGMRESTVTFACGLAECGDSISQIRRCGFTKRCPISFKVVWQRSCARLSSDYTKRCTLACTCCCRCMTSS